MAAAGGACDLKLGRERGAVHRPVFCKRARVIKMSARDIFLAGDPLWALASAFSPVAGNLSRVRVSPAALARALFRRVPSDPEGRGVRSQHTPPSASPSARLEWGLAQRRWALWSSHRSETSHHYVWRWGRKTSELRGRSGPVTPLDEGTKVTNSPGSAPSSLKWE